MKNMTLNHEEVYYYFFFPYLKCSEKININGIDLFSSNKLDELDKESQKIISLISNNFYMAQNYKIKNMIAGYIKERHDLTDHGYNSDYHLNFGKILKIRELIIYLYSSLHPTLLNPFLEMDVSNVFVFRTERQLLDIHKSNNNLEFTDKVENSNSEGFWGLLNGKTFISIKKDEKIFPPYPNFQQNHNQDLFLDINRIDNNSVYNFLNDPQKVNLLFNTSRLIKSIQWYNRSNNGSISDEEQLIYLSVSFESLLDLEKDKNITSRFKNAINILIGSNEKLNAWIDQFYTARSEIVHRGYSNELLFSTSLKKGNKLRYRDLISYGRRIFQISLNSILNSEFFKHRTNLEELFISNYERIELLITNLNKKVNVIETLQKYENVINNIIEYRYVGEESIQIKDILHLISKSIYPYLSSFTPEEQTIANEFIKEKAISEKLIKYEAVHRIINEEKEIVLLNKIDDICWSYLLIHIIRAKSINEETI
ncbi:HEPN domain-containing protein [Clostridium sp.]|uniref:HEPN domain-containing protein n=1 Tax=Clostridium sp. TaxID=1506 RepID=UPI002840EA7D|nr:HEPN domain-containing protein [Clostridium sp.]MDR3598514.1 HEPN domain-containing protein [Clostridium sp.]